MIYENVDDDANIIFGALVDEKNANGEISITVLATGFATDFNLDDRAADAFAARVQAKKEVSVVDGNIFVEGNKIEKKTDLFSALGRKGLGKGRRRWNSLADSEGDAGTLNDDMGEGEELGGDDEGNDIIQPSPATSGFSRFFKQIFG